MSEAPDGADDGGPPARHVVVVGGGIAGLAAAWFLRDLGGAHVRVTVLEAAARTGGKLTLGDVGGLAVDTGAESVLARRPEAVDLVRAVGLGEDLVDPATTAAAVWTRGALRPLPRGQVMGVPTDLAALARSGVVSCAGAARAALDRLVPAKPWPAPDVSLGRYVAARLGREVVDRLVDPLVGGVYAGRADRLSLAATVPVLAPALREGQSLTAVARRALPPADADGNHAPPPPVFAGLRGGVGRLPGAVAAASGAAVRTGVTAVALRRSGGGWLLTTGPAGRGEEIRADAVVVAVPAAPAARLLADAVPAAAAELARIEYASVAVVTLVVPVASTGTGRLPDASGFLVPGVDGRFVKAVTFSSAKWPWVARAAPGRLVLRASVGRHGDQADLQRDDVDLVRRVRTDLAEAAGLGAEPLAWLVTRWGGGLPQYEVGHLERVARVRAAVASAGGVAVCGAAYDGVGIAACVASARLAAEAVLAGTPRPAQ